MRKSRRMPPKSRRGGGGGGAGGGGSDKATGSPAKATGANSPKGTGGGSGSPDKDGGKSVKNAENVGRKRKDWAQEVHQEPDKFEKRDAADVFHRGKEAKTKINKNLETNLGAMQKQLSRLKGPDDQNEKDAIEKAVKQTDVIKSMLEICSEHGFGSADFRTVSDLQVSVATIGALDVKFPQFLVWARRMQDINGVDELGAWQRRTSSTSPEAEWMHRGAARAGASSLGNTCHWLSG